MPQNGFHGLVGMVAAKSAAKFMPEELAPIGVASTILGAMAPDIDMYPTAIAFLVGRKDLIYVVHRSATHSLLLVGLLALAWLGFKKIRPAWAIACLGLSLGVLTHVGLDLFFWFAPLDLFWPFSHVPPEQPFAPIANLWQGISIPQLLVNIREAFEFAAFALLLLAMRRTGRTSALLRWELAAWALFAASLVTAYLFRERPDLQNYVVTTPYLLAFLPLCWIQVWKLRDELARWAVTRP